MKECAAHGPSRLDPLAIRSSGANLRVRIPRPSTSSFVRAVLAYGGVAILVGACAVHTGQGSPSIPVASLRPSIDATLGTPAIGQGSPAPSTGASSLPSVSSLPSPTVGITPQPSLSSPTPASGPLVSVEAHDRLWDPFVDLGPPIGLPYGLRSVRDATELADLIIRGSITDLYIGEQWIGAPDDPGEPFAYLTVQIHEVLKGDPVSRTDGAAEVQFGFGYGEFDTLASEPMPTGEYVWFLLHEATQRENDGLLPRDSEIYPFAYYIPNEVQGVVLNANGNAEVVLADRFKGSWGTERFPMTIRGQSFEGVLEEVRGLVESGP